MASYVHGTRVEQRKVKNKVHVVTGKIQVLLQVGGMGGFVPATYVRLLVCVVRYAHDVDG